MYATLSLPIFSLFLSPLSLLVSPPFAQPGVRSWSLGNSYRMTASPMPLAARTITTIIRFTFSQILRNECHKSVVRIRLRVDGPGFRYSSATYPEFKSLPRLTADVVLAAATAQCICQTEFPSPHSLRLWKATVRHSACLMRHAQCVYHRMGPERWLKIARVNHSGCRWDICLDFIPVLWWMPSQWQSSTKWVSQLMNTGVGWALVRRGGCVHGSGSVF